MAINPQLRDYSKREALWLMVQDKLQRKVAAESVYRTQRRIWEEERQIYKPQDSVVWIDRGTSQK